ncbi:MAG: hypothetical protein Q8M29_16560 [Bacteroidota bacterium]|nr:hypothetical protein [Bacteroidota bacterium]
MRLSKRTKKIIALFLAINLIADAFLPTAAMALTSGPSQPEMQSFTPVSTSDMVDVFSGDFNYNIPLLDVEGYPVNLSYDAGITNDQEASWVGLGWNINPGVINRNMRSLPDDFDGDIVKKELNMRANQTMGISYAKDLELFGKGKKLGGNLTLSAGIKYNNYQGFATDLGANLTVRMHSADKSGYNAGLGLNSSSQTGLGISPSVSYTRYSNKVDAYANRTVSSTTHGIGLHLNSGQGLQAINYSYSREATTYKAIKNSDYQVTGSSVSNSSGGGKFAFTFSNPTYTPYIGNEMMNIGFTFDIAFGPEIIGTSPSNKLSAYYSTQFLKHKEGRSQELRAYGYMNMEHAASSNSNYTDEKKLVDMNREKDGSYTKHTPNLHLTNFTYDVFAVKGQGIGGTFRPHRGDIGVLYDAKVYNRAEGLNGGLGLAYHAGNVAKVGVNVALGQSNAESGMWSGKDGGSEVALSFRSKDSRLDDRTYEPYYFALAGEKVAESDREFYDAIIMGSKPMRINLERRFAKNLFAKNEYDVEGLGVVGIPERNTRNHRAKRNEVFSQLNAQDAFNVAVEKQVYSYTGNNISMFKNPADQTGKPGYPRTDPKNGKSINHHMSELSVVRSDGARYIYGIPAYNLSQEEVSFAVNTSDGEIDYEKGLVSYFSSGDHPDNDDKNNKQIDNFYSRTSMPPYTHSYLLSSVLSVDYVDVDGNGPSSNDLGNYTKFNYTKAIDNNNESHKFKWRIPFEQNMASPNEGMLSKKGLRGDDKASYTYGEKEIWNLHSIETKNYVAVFYTSARKDGFGVMNENGGINSNFPLKKLDKIELYTKKELETNPTNPSPLKTVHFVYDYSLCKGVPNNNGVSELDRYGNEMNAGFEGKFGKLTLKEVFFTYQGSNKGRLSPYKFNYSENYDYGSKNYDRWGNYKPNLPGTNYNYFSVANTTTSEDPYAVQDKIDADKYAAAWALNEIELPSGGKINVNYEADDYAYVQNKRAMQMFKLHGCFNETDLANSNFANLTGNKLYDIAGLGDPQSNLFLAFEIDAPTATSLINNYGTLDGENIKKSFFYNENGALQKTKTASNEDIAVVYFRALIDLNRVNDNNKYEYVSGYATLDIDQNTPDKIGYKNLGGRHFVYFKVKGTEMDDGIAGVTTNNQINPLSMAGMNFTKINFPEVAHNNDQTIDDGVTAVDFINSLVASLKPIIDVFKGGMGKAMWKKGCSSEFVPKKSFVRLYSPTNKKLGGGYRVKELRLNDNWKTLAEDNSYQDSEYGQIYNYGTKDKNGKEISSGVATYEPLIANDENPWRQPVFYSEKNILAPDDDYFQEEPYGESFFPAASVGYSKVEVRSISSQVANLSRHGTGKVVHEFYTAKDFPVKLNKTTVQRKRYNPSKFFPSPLKIIAQDLLAVSQGFVIELNDMHGKQKSQFVYAQGKESQDEYISGIEYKYKRNGDRLDNEVLVINKDGSVQNNLVGLEYDMTVDMNEHRNVSRNAEGQFNADAFILGVIPLGVLTFWPAYHQEEVAFKSAVVTKVINRFGILDQTIAYDLGSNVVTKNKLWDAETGNVLLTETKNNFDDNVYSFNYPAHWAYDRMGGAYQNIGVEMDFAPITGGGNIADPTYSKYFVEGDEVLINNTFKAWVVSKSPFKFLYADGTVVDNALIQQAKIIRSGRRNQAAVSVGQLVALKNPLQWNSTTSKFELAIGTNTEVLNASAIEFNEDWKTFCECGTKPSDKFNPYIKGMKGNWRPFKTYAFLTGRENKKENNNTNIRKDGVYTSYVPYWTNPLGQTADWTRSTNAGWQFASEVTTYSPYGFELENKDALDRFSAAVYGYNNTLPIQVTSNSKYSQTAYDGFEDYDFRACADEHLGMKKAINNAATDADVKQTNSQYQKFSHTGRRSVKVKPGKKVDVTKQLGPCTNPSTGG